MRAFQRLLQKRATPRGDEAGMAMIMVILVSVVLLLVPVALASAVVGQLPLARADQDSSSALAAAEAGVDDYINRLNANSQYWQTSLANTSNNTPPNPSDGNKALTGWVPVASASPTSLVEGYCYTIDMTGTNAKGYTASSSLSSVQGIVQINSYGYSAAAGSLPSASAGANPCLGAIPRGGMERMISVDLRQAGFLDDLELTDLNLVDEAWFNQQQGGNITGCQNNPSASPPQYAYYWANSSAAANGSWQCKWLENYWGTGNVLNGPLRSNDDYYIQGTPVFNYPVTSSDANATVGVNGGPYWANPAGGGQNPDFASGGKITSTSKIQFPSTDGSQKVYGTSPSGCYYIGPTDIYLHGSQMDVVSPLTTKYSTYSNAASCVGTNVNAPADGVIYVDSTTNDCSDTFTGGALNWVLSDPTPLPAGDSCTTTESPGDLFVDGTTSVSLTMYANHNVFVTGDLRDSSTSGNVVMGVVANDYIEIVHAVDTTTKKNIFNTAEPFYGSTTIPTPAGYGTANCPAPQSSQHPDCTVTIQAALLALGHSVGVQAYGNDNEGSTVMAFGTLYIYGALAQEYMDIEGTFALNCNYTTQGAQTNLCTGMNSVYTYDPRLAHSSPPHFLDPSYAEWDPKTYEECEITGCQS